MATIKVNRPFEDPDHVENRIKKRVRPEHQERVRHLVFNELEGKIAPPGMATSKNWRIDLTNQYNQLIARVIGGPGAKIKTVFGPPGYPPDEAFPNIPNTSFPLKSVRAIQPKNTTAQIGNRTTKELSILQEVFENADENRNYNSYNSNRAQPAYDFRQTDMRLPFNKGNSILDEVFYETDPSLDSFIFTDWAKRKGQSVLYRKVLPAALALKSLFGGTDQPPKPQEPPEPIVKPAPPIPRPPMPGPRPPVPPPHPPKPDFKDIERERRRKQQEERDQAKRNADLPRLDNTQKEIGYELPLIQDFFMESENELNGEWEQELYVVVQTADGLRRLTSKPIDKRSARKFAAAGTTIIDENNNVVLGPLPKETKENRPGSKYNKPQRGGGRQGY